MPKASHRDIKGARKLVLLRDGHWCQMCGKSIVDELASIHHRRNKGMGGSALLERTSVLILVCGSGTTGCHGWVGANPDHAEEIGWLIPKLNDDLDPAMVPILIKTSPGDEPHWVLLDDAGNRLLVDDAPDDIEWSDGIVRRGTVTPKESA